MKKKDMSYKGINKSKIVKVMREYKKKKLKTNAGKSVKNRKQAIAIALSEARRYK